MQWLDGQNASSACEGVCWPAASKLARHELSAGLAFVRNLISLQRADKRIPSF